MPKFSRLWICMWTEKVTRRAWYVMRNLKPKKIKIHVSSLRTYDIYPKSFHWHGITISTNQRVSQNKFSLRSRNKKPNIVHRCNLCERVYIVQIRWHLFKTPTKKILSFEIIIEILPNFSRLWVFMYSEKVTRWVCSMY